MSGKRFYVLTGTFAMVGVVALGMVFGFFLGNSNDDAGIDGRTAVTESTTGPGLETTLARTVPSDGVGDSGGTFVGIKVHGHQTIEVRNPDGTLASRSEFDNALTAGGGNMLSRLLAKEISLGLWRINLGGPAGSNHPCGTDAVQSGCFIGEPTDPGSLSHLFKNLVVTGPVDASDNTLTLSGNATAQHDGSVGAVSTRQSNCTPGTAPDVCVGLAFGSQITVTTIGPIPVVTGQQILATVELTFS